MSALGNLKGVWCAECLGRGHKCQAQAVATGPGGGWTQGLECTPLCLRCLDGEPCCFETARALPRIARLVDGLDELPIGSMPSLTAGRMEQRRRVLDAAKADVGRVKLKGEENYFATLRKRERERQRMRRKRVLAQSGCER